jgi:hypothetical protein
MLGHSIVSQHFMEPEGSIPNSQELSTCSYPEQDLSSPHHSSPSIFRSLDRLCKESVQVRGSVRFFVTRLFLWWRVVSPTPNPLSRRTTPCFLSATAYSIYSQLTSISGGRSSIRNPRTRHAVGTGIPASSKNGMSLLPNENIRNINQLHWCH